MTYPQRCLAACSRLRATYVCRIALTSLLALSTVAAHAVVVRGRLTDALGRPIPGGKIELVQSGKVEAIAFASPDGSFEIRSAATGRFQLLGFGGGFLPYVGKNFYGGPTDVVEQNVALSANSIHQDVSVTATGLPTPLPQLTAPVTVISDHDLSTRTGVSEALRQQPGAAVVQTGQGLGQTSLFVRGGPSDANLVLIDGVPAEDVGGVFDFGPVSSTGIASMEIYRGPDSVLYGTDAEASVVNFVTPQGATRFPLFTYSGDAGNLHQVRNEVTAGGAIRKVDYYGAFSRYNTSNALSNDASHLIRSSGNIGYELFPRLLVRGTVNDTVASQGIPGSYDFYNLTIPARQKDHDLYAQGTLDYSTLNLWHNLARYGIARKEETANYYGNVGTLLSVSGFPEYFGNTVTIRGANGFSATGRASIFNSDFYRTSNRDELYYQSDKQFSSHFAALFGFRYTNERGGNIIPSFFETQHVQRTNFEYNLQFQGDWSHRLFYSVGGAIEKNHLYGISGTPRIGLAYFPGRGFFTRTKLRANAATGIAEPQLSEEFESLYRQLTPSLDAQYGVRPLTGKRSRTYDIGVDQSLLRGDRLVLKLGYFHNIFDHQIDFVDAGTLATILNKPIGTTGIFGAETNTLAYRAQGLEFELEARPSQRWFFHGGYTYLDSKVLQSFSTDAAYGGLSTTNPNLPGVPIGSSYPLIGARPFRRPPHVGFFSANYTRNRLSLSGQASMASRADDSTFLSFSDTNGDNSLLLPNRDLDYAYVKLDLGGSWQWKPRFGVFTQLDNLLNDQHIGPIGYPGLPFTVRAGMKFRLGGD